MASASADPPSSLPPSCVYSSEKYAQITHTNSAGDSRPAKHSTFRVGVSEDKNSLHRRKMEDTHSFLYDFMSPGSDDGYFGVFDGHAGISISKWCGTQLHSKVESLIREKPDTSVPEILDEAFQSVNSHHSTQSFKNAGCTAVVAVMRWEDRLLSAGPASKESQAGEESQKPLSKTAPKIVRQRLLYTANVGDARIVLCRNGQALRLSYDHKANDEREEARIAASGGLVISHDKMKRVNGVLAVSRALGDVNMTNVVSQRPYTTETTVIPGRDEFMILACDGLWDVCKDQDAVDLVRNVQDAQEAAEILLKHALDKDSADNVSCMVVRFDTDAMASRIPPERDFPTDV